MKLLKLEASFPPDFELIGIVSSMREYKVAWRINYQLAVNLTKADDIELDFIDENVLRVSCFSFSTDYDMVRLLKNKAYAPPSPAFTYLLPELKEFDFFLTLQSDTETYRGAEVCQQLRQVPQIDYAQVIDWSQVRNRDNLIFF
jgi:hypothetical protein